MIKAGGLADYRSAKSVMATYCRDAGFRGVVRFYPAGKFVARIVCSNF